ncbi:hypothetical protein [Celeribacter sp.]|uniref:hypothetical protein n=1 Tax=Celeribacter sp. TaxID=1890673 RepID=UPI003A95DD4D
MPGLGNVAELGPQHLAALPAEAQAMLAHTVSTALRPIYAIAAALAFAGLLFAFLLEELPLESRHTPRNPDHA